MSNLKSPDEILAEITQDNYTTGESATDHRSLNQGECSEGDHAQEDQAGHNEEGNLDLEAGNPGNAQDEQEATGKEAGKKKPWDEKPIDERYQILDRNFRALQATITPTQQEAARLRAEVKRLREQFGVEEDAGYGSNEDMAREIAVMKEVVPEGGALVERLVADLQARRETEKNEREQSEANRIAETMAVIRGNHQDADTLAARPEFWEFVDSHANGAEMRSILAKPHAFKGGAEYVSMLFKDFKAESAATTLNRPKPSDVAPTLRGSTAGSVSPTSERGKGGKSETEYRREVAAPLRHASPAEAAKHRNTILAQISAEIGNG